MLGSLVTILAVSAATGADLGLQAQLDGRPSYCSAATGAADHLSGGAAGDSRSVWDLTRDPERRQLCRRLALAQLSLLRTPQSTASLAAELTREIPARPEPWVLAARAKTALGAYTDAWALFSSARERGYGFHEPRALHAYALAAAWTEHDEAATGAYRQLLTLLEAWPDPLDRQRIRLEAAAALMRAGPAGLEEAARILEPVRATATSTGLRAFAAGLEALRAQRAGSTEDSRLDAPEIWYFVAQCRAEHVPTSWPVLPDQEAAAAASLLVEPYSSVEAIELWQRHVQALERSDEPWKQRAAERLEHLQGRGGRAR
jgi:hypothetical protein